jgi:hypothetical protein
MVKEVGELELGDRLPEGKLQETYGVRMSESEFGSLFEWMPWLPLYRVWGQGIFKAEGFSDRKVVSLREDLANLSCKLHRLVVHVWAWLSSWSCGHVAAWCDVVLLRQTWRDCRHGGGSPVVLCGVVSVVVFVIASWFPGASYKSW